MTGECLACQLSQRVGRRPEAQRHFFVAHRWRRGMIGELRIGFEAVRMESKSTRSDARVAPPVHARAGLGEKKGRKPITVLRFHRLLCAAFIQGTRWQLLDRNPAELATPPRSHRDEIEIPAIDGFRRVLDAAATSRNPENAMIFRMLAATGCRRGELCGMRWSDVDLDAATIRIPRAIV